jgi:hypothetical protein
MATITHKQYVKRVEKRHGDNVKILGKFTGICYPIEAKCLKCNTTFTQQADALSRYKTQCACEHKKSQPKRLTAATFKTRVEDRLQVKVIGTYTEFRKPVLVKSKVCGHEFTLRANGALWGQNPRKQEVCPKCRETQLHYPLEWFLENLKKVKPHITLLQPKDYAGVTSTCKFHCAKCKVNFFTVARQVLHTKFACPSCVQGHTGYARKNIVLKGKQFKLQGFEPLALKLLAAKVPVKDILVGKEVPRFFYYDKASDRPRNYYPDFYVKSKNCIVEVKSDYTLLGDDDWLRVVKAKRQAVLDKGYDFKLLVFNAREERVALPKNWMHLSPEKLRRLL